MMLVIIMNIIMKWSTLVLAIIAISIYILVPRLPRVPKGVWERRARAVVLVDYMCVYIYRYIHISICVYMYMSVGAQGASSGTSMKHTCLG